MKGPSLYFSQVFLFLLHNDWLFCGLLFSCLFFLFSHTFILFKLRQLVVTTMSTFHSPHHFRSFILFSNHFFLHSTQCNGGLKGLVVWMSLQWYINKDPKYIFCSALNVSVALRPLNLDSVFAVSHFFIIIYILIFFDFIYLFIFLYLFISTHSPVIPSVQ